MEIPSVSERLPPRAEIVPPKQSENRSLTDKQIEMVKQRQQRLDEFVADKMKWLERRAADSRKRAAQNKEWAADVRRRYEASSKQNQQS